MILRRFRSAALVALLIGTTACSGSSDGRGASASTSTTRPEGNPVPAGAVTVAEGATSNVSIDTNSDGSLVAVAWYRFDERSGREQTLVATSTDGGDSFGEPTVVAEPATEYPEVAVLDDGTILVGTVTYDIDTLLDPTDERSWPGWPMIHRSTDGGRTFDVLADLRATVGDRVLTGTMPSSMAASADGQTIVFSYQDATQPALLPAGSPAIVDGTSSIPTWTVISTDGGKRFGPPRPAADASCSCCRMSSFVLGDRAGVALRLLDRTSATLDVRDPAISLADATGHLAAPVKIHDDGYELPLAGCPASGPGVEATDGVIQAAWWTGAEGREGWWYARGSSPEAMGDPVRLPAASTITYETALAADGPEDAWIAGVHVGDSAGQVRSLLLWHVDGGQPQRLEVAPSIDVATQAHDITAVDGTGLLAWVRDGRVRVVALTST